MSSMDGRVRRKGRSRVTFMPALCAAAVLLCGGFEPVSTLIPHAARQVMPQWVRTASAQPAPGGAAQPGPGVSGAPNPARPQIVLPSVGPGGSDLVLDPPSWPEERDLAELQQGTRPELRFFVDRRSLELLPEGEIRYIFVVRNRAGASNVTWETMRCSTSERIILAIGTADRGWSASRFPRWERLERDASGMRALLHRDIFCFGRQPPLSLKHLQSSLKTGLPAPLVPD